MVISRDFRKGRFDSCMFKSYPNNSVIVKNYTNLLSHRIHRKNQQINLLYIRLGVWVAVSGLAFSRLCVLKHIISKLKLKSEKCITIIKNEKNSSKYPVCIKAKSRFHKHCSKVAVWHDTDERIITKDFSLHVLIYLCMNIIYNQGFSLKT